MTTKNIVVTGATGNQGGAVIDALVNNSAFTLLAVTRNASSPGAQKLQSKGNNIKLVEGDQDDSDALFAKAAQVAGGPIWGAYSVQVFQGRGASHESELRQGKAMVDAAVKAGVKHFVYSSVDRGGDEESWKQETPVEHFRTKHYIEQHLRQNAGGMGWTILRPVAFMDNLAPNFQSRVFMTVLQNALREKPLQFVAVQDIGVFAAKAFSDPSTYNQKAIGLAGDELNTKQISEVIRKRTGKPLDATFGVAGTLLRVAMPEIAKMTDWFANPGYNVDIAACRRTHPGMLTMDAWLATPKSPFYKASP